MKPNRGDRKKDRKVHAHMSWMQIPRAVWRRWVDKGIRYKEKIGYDERHNGMVLNHRRGFGYHPTKGWRNRNILGDGFNLTLYMVHNLRRK